RSRPGPDSGGQGGSRPDSDTHGTTIALLFTRASRSRDADGETAVVRMGDGRAAELNVEDAHLSPSPEASRGRRTAGADQGAADARLCDGSRRGVRLPLDAPGTRVSREVIGNA